MKHRRDSLFIHTTFLLITLIFFSRFDISLARGISESEALAAIHHAQGLIEAGYASVLEADEVGADVTVLLTILNEAGMILSRAKLSYKTGDYDSALLLVNQIRELLDGFVEEVNISTENATFENFIDILINVVGSILGAISILCGGTIIWYVLTRKERDPRNLEGH